MAVYYVTPFKWPSFEYKLWLEILKAALFQEAANWGCLPRVYSSSRFLSITTQTKWFFPPKLLETTLRDQHRAEQEPKQCGVQGAINPRTKKPHGAFCLPRHPAWGWCCRGTHSSCSSSLLRKICSPFHLETWHGDVCPSGGSHTNTRARSWPRSLGTGLLLQHGAPHEPGRFLCILKHTEGSLLLGRKSLSLPCSPSSRRKVAQMFTSPRCFIFLWLFACKGPAEGRVALTATSDIKNSLRV